MKLEELQESKKPKKGTYAGVNFSDATIKAVHQYAVDNKIPKALKPEKYHTTVLYSRKYLPNYKPAGTFEKPLVGKFTGFDIWKSSPDKNEDPTNCLVMEFDCPELTKRHNDLMDEHDATYDFDEYKTHITLSYDVGDLTVDSLPKFKDNIDIVSEYHEDLNLNWAEENEN